MRISNNMMVYNFLSSINKSQERMNSLQEKLSDGKKFHRPSDDPIGVMRSLRFNVNVTVNDQYTQNVKDGLTWMNETDSAISDLQSLIARVKEIVIDATSPNPNIAYEAYASELDGLINQAVALGNTQLGDRYIFAGQQDKVVGGPFERVTIAGVEQVIYKGDTNKISMRIQPGNPNPSQDSVNVTGEEVFGPGTPGANGEFTLNIFRDLLTIKEELATGAPDLDWLSNTALASVDAAQDRFLKAHTAIGTRMASYEMAESFLSNELVTITENLSANEDLDVPRALMDFQNNENIYRTALSVGARIMPPSLADFLK